MSETTLLTRKEIENIPQEMLPMPVLSDNLRSFFAWGIKVHTKGCYNHFMWMIEPGVVASQNLFYGKQWIREYFDNCRLKFWSCPSWTFEQRETIYNAIYSALNAPWYSRLYDVPAILGQLLPWHSVIQTPGLEICSDYGNLIKKVDGEYNLHHPDPTQVDKWLSEHKAFEVYGRYVPD